MEIDSLTSTGEDNDCPRFVEIDELSTIVITEGMDVVARCNDNNENEENNVDEIVVIAAEKAPHLKPEPNDVEVDTYSPPLKQRKKRGRKPKAKSLGQICGSDNEDKGT